MVTWECGDQATPFSWDTLSILSEEIQLYIIWTDFLKIQLSFLVLALNSLICNLIVFVSLWKTHILLCQDGLLHWTMKMQEFSRISFWGESSQWCSGAYFLPEPHGISALLSYSREKPTTWDDSRWKDDYLCVSFKSSESF